MEIRRSGPEKTYWSRQAHATGVGRNTVQVKNHTISPLCSLVLLHQAAAEASVVALKAVTNVHQDIDVSHYIVFGPRNVCYE